MTPALLTNQDSPLAPALPGRPLVLVATDGSPTGTLALDHALDASRILGARLCVLHVLPDPLPSGRPDLYDVQLTSLRLAGEAILKAARQRLRFVGADFALQECRGRRISHVILDEAGRRSAIGVVLGTHGCPLGKGKDLGSVAREVLNGATMPVTLIDRNGEPRRDLTVRRSRALS